MKLGPTQLCTTSDPKPTQLCTPQAGLTFWPDPGIVVLVTVLFSTSYCLLVVCGGWHQVRPHQVVSICVLSRFLNLPHLHWWLGFPFKGRLFGNIKTKTFWCRSKVSESSVERYKIAKLPHQYVMLSYCCACLFFLLLFLWLFARLVVCLFTWSTRTSHRSVVGGSGPGWLFVTVTHCGFVGAEYLDWIAADAILYPHTILYQVVHWHCIILHLSQPHIVPCCIQTKQRYITITPCCRHHSDSKGPISISWTLPLISILCKHFSFCTNTMHNTMQNATDQSAYLARSLWSAFGAGPNHNATHLGLGAVLMSIFCYKLYNESQLPTLIC